MKKPSSFYLLIYLRTNVVPKFKKKNCHWGHNKKLRENINSATFSDGFEKRYKILFEKIIAFSTISVRTNVRMDRKQKLTHRSERSDHFIVVNVCVEPNSLFNVGESKRKTTETEWALLRCTASHQRRLVYCRSFIQTSVDMKP